MSGNVGRLAKLKKGGSVLAGVRTKSITWSGESVDVSSSEDGGVRLLLSASGQEQIDVPIEGITKDDTLLKISLDTTSDKMLTDITLDFDIRNPINTTPATLSGNFRLSGYEEGMPYNDAITFSATLESSDGWDYTPEGSYTPSPGAVQEFFSADYVVTTGWGAVSSSSAVYDATLNKTFISWQIVPVPDETTGYKSIRITSYDHTTSEWEETRALGSFYLPDDDHGHPALVVDNDGYIHSLYGAHGPESDFSQSSSLVPGNIEKWAFKKNEFTDATYPSLDNVGGTIYMLYRNDAVSTRRLLAVRSGTPTSGDLTLGSEQDLVDLGADSRFYPKSVQARGTDIHLIASRANAVDSERVGVYYFIYDTITGDVLNFDKSFSTASVSLPVQLSSANANYIIVDMGAEVGDTLGMQFDSSGSPHVIYCQAPVASTHYDMLHIYLNGGAWTSPEVLASVKDLSAFGFVNRAAITTANDDMWVVYNSDDGDALRRVRKSGVWGAEEVLISAGALDITSYIPIKYAPPTADINLILSESSSAVGAVDADAQRVRRWFTSPENTPDEIIDLSAGDADFYDVTALFGFDGEAGATEIYDESYGNHLTEVAGGSVQLSAAQSKFGTTSLLFDNTTSYMLFGKSGEPNSEFSIEGDFTLEVWAYFNAVSSPSPDIASKRAEGGQWLLGVREVSGVNVLRMAIWDDSAIFTPLSGVTEVTTAEWHHIAFSRNGSTGRIFLDGVLEDTQTISTVNSSTNLLCLGANVLTLTPTLDGYLNEFRITKGVGRYTDTFTPPSSKFPRIPTS